MLKGLPGLLAALCALALAAPAAHAADQVIGFDDLPSGTTVTDQYKALNRRSGVPVDLVDGGFLRAGPAAP